MNNTNILNLHFFLILLLINCSPALQIRQKIKNTFIELKQQPDTYNMVIFGNTGEIQFYTNLTSLSEDLNDKEKETYYEKNIFSQKYTTNRLSCHVTNKDSNSVNLLNEQGLNNFQTVLNDKVVIEYIRISDEILFLGDIVNPGYDKFIFKNIGKKNAKNLSFFESRIKCGWNIFINTLKNANLAKITTNQKKDKIEISNKLNFNKGKFSQKINMDLEDSIINNFKIFEDKKRGHVGKINTEGFLNSKITPLNLTSADSNRFSLGKTPIITTVVYLDFTLQIIDFDSNLLNCLSFDNESDYMVCIKKRSFTYLTFHEATNYALKLNKILNTKVVKSKAGKQVWKVMRAYHPPIYSLRKSNLFYFKNITAISNGGSITFNLWESIKKNLINIFFSSSDNNASLSVVSYSLVEFTNSKFSCFRRKFEDVGCYYYLKTGDQIDYSKSPLTKKDCDNDMFFKLPYKANTNKIEESFLYVFNVGNSGTKLEKLEYGYTANSFLFWARAQKDYNIKEFIHGFALTTFTKGYIDVKFMETEIVNETKSTKTYKAATFRVTESAIPDHEKLNQFIKQSICKDFLVEGRGAGNI